MIRVKINESRRPRRDAVEIASIELSEVTVDGTGVQLYFRPHNTMPKEHQHQYIYTEEMRAVTVERLRMLYPFKYMEKYSMRITLGEWIDLAANIM